MNIKLFTFYLFLTIVTANFSVDVSVDSKDISTINYTGEASNIITHNDIKLFELDTSKLKDGIARYLNCHKPDEIYFKNPTKWGDVYTAKEYQVHKVLSIKSARVTKISKRPVVVSSQDFVNFSNETIKVNTGISHSIERTLTTSWSMESEFAVEAGVSAELNFFFASVGGSLQFSYTTKWGVNAQESQTETIGTSSGMEMELKPGRAVTAVLTASAGYLEIEVVHKASLAHVMEVYFNTPCQDNHHYRMLIESVMGHSDLSNEKTAVETIRVGYYIDGSLKVYDKSTGLLLF